MNYGDITFINIDGKRLTLAGTCSVSRQNTIVSTPLVGRAGSVKEYVQAEDWRVEISVAIDGEQRDYPAQKIQEILRFFENSERHPYTVQSDYLELFNINCLVVEAKSLQQTTHASRQEFSLSCVSDTPYEMKITE